MTSHHPSRRTCARVLAVVALAVLLPPASMRLRADEGGAQAPNYALAAQWTVPKINKLIFDTQVTPHWLEFSDRFWYSYETRDGKRYFLVNPSAGAPAAGAAAKTAARNGGVKTPLFDQPKLAEQLAAATLVPLEAQHLPI